MKNFRTWLKQKGFAQNTIQQNVNYTEKYIQFLQSENIKQEQAKYTDILTFIEKLDEQNIKTNLKNRYLLAVRHFYEFLNCGSNPAENVILKGQKRNIPSNLLNEKELQELYEKYEVYDLRTQRNKIIIELLINQALTRAELQKLKPEHILLKKGKIIIPGSKRTNQRTLKLQASQIIELQEYINTTRENILKINKKNTSETEQLFVSIHGKPELKNSLLHLFRALRKINKSVKNANQIRMSVIANKLKHNNLREVQYFAGHKYVSSTERYKLNNIENLKKEIEKYHPLND